MMQKAIVIALVLILVVSFSGCFGPTAEEAKDKKIGSKEEALDKTAEVSDDLEGLSGSLKDLDEELG